MKQPTSRRQPAGTKLERVLRTRRFQTDQLTLSIARNQRALERFAERYGLVSLLTPQARGTFAAMTTEECARVLDFLQVSLHVGRRSLKTREQWQKDAAAEGSPYLAYLAALVDKPELVDAPTREMFRRMRPDAQRVTAMILLAAWQVTERAPSTQDRYIKSDVLDRIVEQIAGEATVAGNAAKLGGD